MVWHATKLPTVQSLPIHAKIIAQNALLRKESEPHKMQRQLNNSAVPSKVAAAAVSAATVAACTVALRYAAVIEAMM